MITLAQRQGAPAQFRIEMGLVTPGGKIAPVALPTLRRPTLVGQLLDDERLRCSVRGQVVDARYDMIRNPAYADLLITAANQANRLPLIVVNTSWQSIWRARENRVKYLSAELAGIARVAALSHSSSVAELRRRRVTWTPAPDHGVVLWPGAPDQPVPFALADLDQLELGGLVRLVAQAAGISYSDDPVWMIARAERNAAAHQRAQPVDGWHESNSLSHADTRGSDLALALAAMRTERDEKSEWVEALEEENQRLILEVRGLTAQNTALESENLRLEFKIKASQYATVPAQPEAGDLDNLIDELRAADEPDVVQAMTQLQEAAGGALIFTPTAHESWAGTNFHAPRDMLDNLCRLAQVAVLWRAAHGKPGIGLEQWLKANGFSSCSVSDNGLQARKLHRFTFEGDDYDQTPHIKLGEHTSPDRVGRIYFDALHSDPARFVVNHVGLKLYGI